VAVFETATGTASIRAKIATKVSLEIAPIAWLASAPASAATQIVSRRLRGRRKTESLLPQAPHSAH
jgi:hypothetical protein